MSGKSDISFLLNPQPTVEDMCVQLAPPMSPPPSAMLARLAAMAQSPAASATSSSLLLLGSCIAPLKKVASSCNSDTMTCKKPMVPALSLAALCEASSGSSNYSSSGA
ncbi:hypothetical protein F443_09059, partial [Phytophthora nicotianae P1569]